MSAPAVNIPNQNIYFFNNLVYNPLGFQSQARHQDGKDLSTLAEAVQPCGACHLLVQASCLPRQSTHRCCPTLQWQHIQVQGPAASNTPRLGSMVHADTHLVFRWEGRARAAMRPHPPPPPIHPPTHTPHCACKDMLCCPTANRVMGSSHGRSALTCLSA